jgi:zinc resistance-associated protein
MAVALLQFQHYEVIMQMILRSSQIQLTLMEVKMNKKTKGIIVVTVVAIFGITTLSFAGWGSGYGHMMGPMMGPGWNQMGGYGYDQGRYPGNLSSEEIAKLDQQRAEFFKATETTRQKLYEDEMALRSELAKENPDTAKASSLQSEISKLQGDLDQKRLDYDIQARKSAPSYGRGYGRYGPMMGNGPMMGYGSGGGGYCSW